MDNAGGAEDIDALIWTEAAEDIAGEEGPVDRFYSIRPAPARLKTRVERLQPANGQCVTGVLFKVRADAQRKPRDIVRICFRGVLRC